MGSHHIGSRKDIELLVIDTELVSVVLKGKVNPLKYRQHSEASDEKMGFKCVGKKIKSIKIYDVLVGDLVDYDSTNIEPYLSPIFFENGNYEILIEPTKGVGVSFYHEYEPFREAVNVVSGLRTKILTGQLHYKNEVGLSSFEIRSGDESILNVMIEVFPTKLDYKKDYAVLLDEVNEEIYNLAYHFIKGTYMKGSAKIYKDPSSTEFYRLLEQHFQRYLNAIKVIERMPHHQLTTRYEEVRGERLRKQDSKSLAYLRKNTRYFADVKDGIKLSERSVMPTKGLLIKKEHTMDTHENRYIKWTMERLKARIGSLIEKIGIFDKTFNRRPNREILNLLDHMVSKIEHCLCTPFWKSIGKLDRSVMSLVLQMALGYRDVFQIYATLSKSIELRKGLYKMSIKDIATLYEYWTFLKLGKILGDKCEQFSQNVVKVNRDGLFVNLEKSKRAERRFKNIQTGEDIILEYQYSTSKKNVPTVQQRPDSMLSIGKIGKNYKFQYIFDAKYRIDFGEDETSLPGPLQDDINTMHRYRDAIVVESDGKYSRTSFGAYVLFPWNKEDEYQNHPLYKSIEKVNIGGLPFLPNVTQLVEKIIDNLLTKTADELQAEGILPRTK